MNCFDIIATVSIFIVAVQFLRFFCRLMYCHVIAPNLGFAVKFSEVGKWAVVTGATDGIGKTYAELLAKEGINIVLISRSEEKLQDVAQNIVNAYKVLTKIIVADFTDGEQIYHHIEKQLTGIEVGILVNNVGISYPYPEYFLDIPNKDKLYPNIINCNIMSVMNMCKIVMPGMVERKKGIVINIASTASLISSPLLTVYGASKAFVEKFSFDLATEYEKSGVIVQCVLPGYVATKMSKIRSATWMSPNPNTYVQSALKTVGIQNHTTGYIPHSLLVNVIRIINYISPSCEKLIVMKTMKNIRGRALRRMK